MLPEVSLALQDLCPIQTVEIVDVSKLKFLRQRDEISLPLKRLA
jgi:hypothetical protein